MKSNKNHTAPLLWHPLMRRHRVVQQIMLSLLVFLLGGQLQAQSWLVGAPSPAIGTSGSYTTGHFLIFDVMAPTGIIIDSVTIYPTSSTAGQAYTVVLQNSAQTVIASYSSTTTAVSSQPERIKLDFAVPPGTGYRLGLSNNPGGMLRNDAGAVYPYTVPNVISITGSTFQTYYYFFYNWRVKLPVSYNDDAGVSAITAPASPAVPGSNQVAVNITNYGTGNLTNATLGWSVNGVSQGTTPWNGNLAPGAVANNVVVGNFNFPQGLHVIKAWTEMPNGAPDSLPENDTSSSQVVVCNPLSGTFTVGAGGDFPDMVFALGALQQCGIGGPVIINVLPGSGPYAGGIEVGAISGSSATNTITINGNGNVINEGTPTYILAFNGSSYITLDNFQIINSNTANNKFGIMVRGGSHHLQITNNLINVGTTSTSTAHAGIAVSGSTTSATTAGNNAQDLTITGNEVVGGYYAITLLGEASYLNNSGHIISNNLVRDFYLYGIYLANAENCMVENNEVNRATRASVSTLYGIYLSTSRNIKVKNNKVHSTGTGSYSAYPIYVTTSVNTPGSETEFINNAVYNIPSTSTVYGIYFLGTRDYLNVYHNTVHLTSTGSGAQRAFFASTTPDNHRLVNNIFSVQGNGTGTKYCIYSTATSTTFYSDKNILYMGATAGTNYAGYWAANQTTLANWQTTTGQDLTSLDLNPLFSDAMSISPQSYKVDNMGTFLSSVTHDLNGVLRNATTPDIGALEFTGTSFEIKLGIASGCDHSTIMIPVNVMNFNNMGAVSLAINFDNTGLVFTGLQGTHANFNGLMANADGNILRLSWVSANGTGVSMPNWALTTLVFNTLDAGTYNLTWNLDPNETEVVDPNGNKKIMESTGSVVTIINCSNISGVIRYNNEGNNPPIAGAPTPLNNVRVQLFKQDKELLDEMYTNATGQYAFTDVPNGNYTLKLSTVKAWGGVNSVDALAIMKHFVGMEYLTGIRLKASDVDYTGFTNVSDALQVSRRFVGQVQSFAAGNWAFETDSIRMAQQNLPGPPPVIIPAYNDPKLIALVNDTILNIYGLTYGDCNGTYNPPATKQASTVGLSYKGSLQIAEGQEVRIPFHALEQMEAGALALILEIPSGLDIRAVEMATEEGHLDWAVMNGELRISWFSLNPMPAAAHTPLFHVVARVNDLNNAAMRILEGSEMADGHAKVFSGALYTPVLTQGEASLMLEAYPNPFNQETQVMVQLPEDGQLNLELYNTMGAKVATLTSGLYPAGTHQFNMQRQGLPSGMYLLSLQYKGQTSTLRLVVR